MLLSGFYHHHLGVAPSFHMLGLSDSLCCERLWIMQSLVTNFVFLQAIKESFWYFQKPPPIETITFPQDSLPSISHTAL